MKIISNKNFTNKERYKINSNIQYRKFISDFNRCNNPNCKASKISVLDDNVLYCDLCGSTTSKYDKQFYE